VCVADVFSRLAERMAQTRGGTPRYARLAADLEAAAQWIGTALDCAAVDGYCFEPEVDPGGAW
jgi:hypothetical protein